MAGWTWFYLGLAVAFASVPLDQHWVSAGFWVLMAAFNEFMTRILP